MKWSDRHLKLLFLYFLIFWSINAIGQKSLNTTFNKAIPRIYFMDGFGKAFNEFAKSNGVGTAKLITRSYLYDINSNTLIPEKLVNRIREFFPDSLCKGVGILDWEGPAFLTLINGKVDDPAYQKALTNFINAIRLAKKQRPNVKWGFYGIPFNIYWHRDAHWKDNCNKIIPLLKFCDIFCPSLYEPYKANTFYQGDDSAYVTDNMKEMLELGDQLNKPVFPFVWYRYHPANKTIGLDLIPPSEFEQHVRQILSVRYRGLKAHGIIVYEMSYNLSNSWSSQAADLKPFEMMKKEGYDDGQLYHNISHYRDSLAIAYCKVIQTKKGLKH